MEQLELHSFLINEENCLPNIELYQLELPNEWSEFLKSYKVGDYKYSLNIGSFSKLLQSKFPQLVSVLALNTVIDQGIKPWIIASEQIDVRIIHQLFVKWLSIELNKDVKDLPETVRNQCSLPQWKHFYRKDVLNQPYQYDVIPGAYAHDFCKRSYFIKSDEMTLEFKHVRTDKGHEVMSDVIEVAGEHFMYVIHFKLTTRALHGAQKYLNIKSSIRKVVSSPLIGEDGTLYLKGGKNISVYLSTANPYLNTEGRSFAHMSIKRKKNAVEWSSDIEKHFVDMLTEEKGFSIDNLLKNPKAYFPETGRDVIALINESIHSVGNPTGKLKSGVGLPTRREFFKVITQQYPNLILNDKLPKVPSRYNKKERILLFPLSTERLTFEIYTEDEKLFDRVQAEIVSLLNLEKKDDHLFVQQRSQVEFQILHLQLGDLVKELDGEDKAAVKKRIKELKQFFKHRKANEPIMALIEIFPYNQNLMTEKKDPKDAIRIGMLEAGRITQFIYPLEDENGTAKNLEDIIKRNNSRVKNSVLDLLSDKGFSKTINQDELIIGVSNYKSEKGNRVIPLLCKIDNNRKYIKKYIDKDWLPIDCAITSLNAESIQKSVVSTDRICSWIEQEMEFLLEEHPSKTIVLLLDAALRSRKTWAELLNEEIRVDQLPLQNDQLKWNERIKVIRINDADEVPYYDITTNKDEITKSSGLFRDDKGIYYSIGSRPDSLKAKKSFVKVYRTDHIGKQQNVELIVSGCDSQEERDRLAIMCHHLRRDNLTYEFSTKWPLPMHCLKTLNGYIDAFIKLND
ncbi:hypothetical protein AT864_03081 [Anoxybacillus sp. P3H1B]|uniref:pPIWI_RE module domain-containing protein n=1 Tax=Anoxybacillus sp. P3H1B TaxID=1769293 RepID=UPI000797E1A8|nr:DUF3962 domain-containing protein [Anoxybacillus sp. P3H1B]KXG08664.1 hypothetical protein AT864_03081 [Anoxybacillus sp. P3H1B]